MQRRHFIRVLGGGVVLAAGTAASGCSSAVPPEAIAAWQGPGAETDVRRWILSYAILAPHSHNLQSWVVDLRHARTRSCCAATRRGCCQRPIRSRARS